MTEPLPITQTPSEPLAYQPISGWAIAGFTIGCLFALLVAICAIVGVAQARPCSSRCGLWPSRSWAWPCPSWANAMCKIPRGRAGLKLARAGMWLSLVSGLAYFSYYAVTGMALQSQADAFLRQKTDDKSGFFPRLGANPEGGDNPIQLNTAFLFTLPPSSRSGRPDDEISMCRSHDVPAKEGTPGLLTQFRQSVFGRAFFRQLGKDAVITPLAVQDWRYEKRSYKVFRTYHVKTKEVDMDLMLAVLSAEAESPGQSRRWFVDLKESYVDPGTKKLTPIGEGLRQLRQQAGDWLGKRGHDELSLGDLGAADKTDWSMIPVPPDKKKAELEQRIHGALTPGSGGVRNQKFKILTRAEDIGGWEQLDGKVRVELLFSFEIPASSSWPPLRVEGVATPETTAIIDPATFNADSPRPSWNLARVVFTAVRPIRATPVPQ